ncbi:MAG: cell division protein ZapB [Vicinamibacterales bacterium]
MAKPSSAGAELEPIDRLENKLKQLLGVVDRMKGEHAKLDAENKKLKADVDTLRAKVAAGETLSSELATLREERDVIRARVGEMLEQLDALDV